MYVFMFMEQAGPLVKYSLAPCCQIHRVTEEAKILNKNEQGSFFFFLGGGG